MDTWNAEERKRRLFRLRNAISNKDDPEKDITAVVKEYTRVKKELAGWFAWQGKEEITKQYNFNAGIRLSLLSLSLHQDNPFVYLQLSYAQWTVDQRYEAVQSAAKALQIAPYNLKCYGHLCWLCYELGDFQQCCTVAETAQRVMQSPNFRYYSMEATDQFGTKYDPEKLTQNIAKYLKKSRNRLEQSNDFEIRVIVNTHENLPHAAELPFEVLVDILLLLPLEDLIRATQVTKYWYSLWSNASFCKAVLTREVEQRCDSCINMQYYTSTILFYQEQEGGDQFNIDWIWAVQQWCSIYKMFKCLENSQKIRDTLSTRLNFTEQSKVQIQPYKTLANIMRAEDLFADCLKPKGYFDYDGYTPPRPLNYPFHFPLHFIHFHMLCSGLVVKLVHHEPHPLIIKLFPHPLPKNYLELAEKFKWIEWHRDIILDMMFFPAEGYLRAQALSKKILIGHIDIHSDTLNILMELDDLHYSTFGRIVVVHTESAVVTDIFPNLFAFLQQVVQHNYSDLANRLSLLKQ